MAMLNRVSAGFARHCEAQYCQEVEMGKLKDQRIAQLTEQLNARNNLNVKMCEELADEIVQLTNKNCKLRKKRAAFPTKKGK
jgi:ribosomal protein S7